jgi:cobyrinic acid a,c-diamide synthase
MWLEGKEKRLPAFVIAATHSGAGKTTCALGVMAALRRRGLEVQPFKVGPDFIDPGHHTRITGRASRNLDGWMLTRSYNQHLFSRLAGQADCAIVEGVMGLYDGYSGISESGSTAEMAKWLGLPVLLVVDASSMARSAAAIVKGFETFDRSVRLAGVVFNRVGSSSHLEILREAVSRYCSVPCLGGFPRDAKLTMPERHLGLVTSEEQPLTEEEIDNLVVLVERHLDLSYLLETCLVPFFPSEPFGEKRRDQGLRIAVARDEAFCFYYPDNLELLTEAGAELVFFSPLKDKEIPKGCQGIYIGGGYPEVFSEQLMKNVQMRDAIRRVGEQGCPIYAECGGLMYLSRGIVMDSGKHYDMAGLFPFVTRMLPRFRALGYREIRLREEGPLGPAGLTARGHEFHYSRIEDDPKTCRRIYEITGRKGQVPAEEGYRVHNSLASYVHLHFGSHPKIAENWIRFCLKWGVST